MKWLGSPLTEVGDAGLVHLEGLTGLRLLVFDYKPITDEGDGLIPQGTDPSSSNLALDGTRVSSPYPGAVNVLTRLARSSLSCIALDDAGL